MKRDIAMLRKVEALERHVRGQRTHEIQFHQTAQFSGDGIPLETQVCITPLFLDGRISVRRVWASGRNTAASTSEFRIEFYKRSSREADPDTNAVTLEKIGKEALFTSTASTTFGRLVFDMDYALELDPSRGDYFIAWYATVAGAEWGGQSTGFSLSAATGTLATDTTPFPQTLQTRVGDDAPTPAFMLLSRRASASATGNVSASVIVTPGLQGAYDGGDTIDLDLNTPVGITHSSTASQTGYAITVDHPTLTAYTGTPGGFHFDAAASLSTFSNASNIYGVRLEGATNAGGGDFVGLGVEGFDVAMDLADGIVNINIPDNTDSALSVLEGTNNYLDFHTVNGSEWITIGDTLISGLGMTIAFDDTCYLGGLNDTILDTNSSDALQLIPESGGTATHVLVGGDVGTGGGLWLKQHTAYASSWSKTWTTAVQTTDGSTYVNFPGVINLPVNGISYWIEVMVTGRDAADADFAAYQVLGHAYRAGGTTTLGASTTTTINETTASMDARLNANGHNIEIQVRGVTSTTINWAATVRAQFVSGNA